MSQRSSTALLAMGFFMGFLSMSLFTALFPDEERRVPSTTVPATLPPKQPPCVCPKGEIPVARQEVSKGFRIGKEERDEHGDDETVPTGPRLSSRNKRVLPPPSPEPAEEGEHRDREVAEKHVPLTPTPSATSLDLAAGLSPVLSLLKIDADATFTRILSGLTGRKGLVVEVGSYDGSQAMQAYRLGYRVIVLEPSPKNHEKVLKEFTKQAVNTSKMQLWQLAASSTDQTLQFFTTARGGTGDHVTIDGHIHPGEEKSYSGMKGKKVEVQGKALNELFPNERIFFLKVDVQGHELHVLRGATKLFEEQRVAIAMFEFHPKQMGYTEAVLLLHRLDKWGYELHYSMRWAPGYGFDDDWLLGPQAYKEFTRQFQPYDGWRDGFGGWTDILAVCRTCVSRNADPSAAVSKNSVLPKSPYSTFIPDSSPVSETSAPSSARRRRRGTMNLAEEETTEVQSKLSQSFNAKRLRDTSEEGENQEETTDTAKRRAIAAKSKMKKTFNVEISLDDERPTKAKNDPPPDGEDEPVTPKRRKARKGLMDSE